MYYASEVNFEEENLFVVEYQVLGVSLVTVLEEVDLIVVEAHAGVDLQIEENIDLVAMVCVVLLLIVPVFVGFEMVQLLFEVKVDILELFGLE